MTGSSSNIGMTDVHRRPQPIVLLVLDGWGVSPSWGGNAIGITDPPTYNYLWKHYPHQILQAFRTVAGPSGIVGSSEIGHASIGSGRIVEQDLTEINLLIDNGQFYENPTIRAAMASARDAQKTLHLTGLLSEGGIHGSIRHAEALVTLAKQVGVSNVQLHVITDGRDSESTQALEFITQVEQHMAKVGLGRIATVMGRFYGMNRDGYWDRTEQAYRALTDVPQRTAQTAREAVSRAYAENLDDEHILPTAIGQTSAELNEGRIQDNDALIHWNFRADRARQLIQALIDPTVLRRFLVSRKVPVLSLTVVSMTDYHVSLPGLRIAFPSATIETTLGQLLANHEFTQLHVAESEKQAHVTYFFNGGQEEPYEGEDRIIVPSPRAGDYSTVPAMSAGAITRVLERAIKHKSHDFIVANYANVDLVAHTGNLHATGKAVLVVDEAIRRIANAVIDVDGVLMVTADHGNAESVATMKRGDRETIHSLNPVPFIYMSRSAKKQRASGMAVPSARVVQAVLQEKHSLADVAPTILELFGIPKPSDMTGQSLFGSLE